MDSLIRSRSTLGNPPIVAPSPGKRPITISSLLHSTTRQRNRSPSPERDDEAFYENLKPLPRLSSEQFNIAKIRYPHLDLSTLRIIPFNPYTPHIGFVSLERFLNLLPANCFQRTRLTLAERTFEIAAWIYDRALYEQIEAVLERFMELLRSDSDGNTTFEEVMHAFCAVAAEAQL
ncbi:hypothetical protein AOQ84DRAFT_377142 [Glonium stellatum]|uniref:EF-hand domain-containing protein n=1 Tax=Glonium stellatum TaxID=574774 RepID=A0A8E2EZY5_9PEZI|nr:hypothetical protein AOQ84DRAFT_377142 [Glonium stellatum]